MQRNKYVMDKYCYIEVLTSSFFAWHSSEVVVYTAIHTNWVSRQHYCLTSIACLKPSVSCDLTIEMNLFQVKRQSHFMLHEVTNVPQDSGNVQLCFGVSLLQDW